MNLGGVCYMVNPSANEEIPFLEKLNHVTQNIELFQKKYCHSTDSITSQDISELLKDLELYDAMMEGSLENRKLVLVNGRKANQRIEQALNAILSFQKINPEEGTKKNIRQVIASLFNDSEKEKRRFEESVKNLRKKWDSYMSKIHESAQSNKT